MPTIVGEALVRLRVISSGLSRDISREVRDAVRGASKDIDASGKDIGDRMSKSAGDGLKKNNGVFGKAGTDIGQKFNAAVTKETDKLAKRIGLNTRAGLQDAVKDVDKDVEKTSKKWNWKSLTKAGKDAGQEIFKGFNLGLGAARMGAAVSGLLVLAGPSILSAAGGLGVAIAGELVSAIGAIGPGLTGALIGAGAGFATLALNVGLLKLAFSGTTPQAKALKAEIATFKDTITNSFAPGVLSGFSDLIGKLKDNLIPAINDQLAQTGEAMGNIARGIGDTVTSAGNLTRIQGILATNKTFLDNFGVGLNGLTTSFLILFNAAKPFVDALGVGAKTFGEWASSSLAASEANGKLASFMDGMLSKFQELWGIVKDLGIGIFNIFQAAAPVSERLAAGLADVAARFREWTGSEEGQTKMTAFFEKAHRLVGILGSLFSGLGSTIASAFSGMDTSNLEHVVATIRDVLFPAVASIFSQIKAGAGDNLTIVFDNLAGAVKTLADGGNIEKVASALSGLLVTITNFANTDLGQTLISVLGPLAVFGGLISNIAGPLIAIGEGIAGVSAGLASILGVVAAVAGAFVLMWQNSESFRSAVSDLVTVLKGDFLAIWDKIGPKIEGVWEKTKALAEALGNFLAPVIRALTPVISFFVNAIGTLFGGFLDQISNVFQFLTDLFSGNWSALWGDALAVISTFWDVVKGIFGGVVGWLGGLVAGIWDSVLTWTKEKLGELGDWISGIWDSIFEAVSGKIGEIRDQVVANFGQMVSDVEGVWNGITEWFGGIMTDIGDAISTGWNWVIDNVTESMRLIGDQISTAWDGILSFLGTVWNGILDLLHFLFDPWIDFFTQLWQVISDGVSTAWNAVFDWISTRWNDFVALLHGIFDPWVGIFQGIWDGIQNVFHTVVDNVYNWITTRWNDFLTLLHSIFDPWPGIFQGIWDGISNVFHTVVDAVAGWLSGKWNEIKTNTESIWNEITGIASTVWNAIIDAIHTVVDPVVAWIAGKWEEIKTDISTAGDTIATAARIAWDAIYDAIIQPIQDAIDWVSQHISDLTGPISDAWDTISGIFGNITSGVANAASSVASLGNNPLGAPTGAEGGYINPVPGGQYILAGEAGQRERLEPLDSQGLSARDRALISHIVSATIASTGVAGGGAVVVDVNVNAGAMKGIIDASITQSQSALARRANRARGVTT